MKTFRVGIMATEHKNASIEAASEDDARKIAEESVAGERSDVHWKTVDFDDGEIVLIEDH